VGFRTQRKKEHERVNLWQHTLTLTGFLSEHCRLKGHLKRIGLGKLGDCRFCGDEEETPEHLLCECDAVSNIRTNLFGSSIINDGEGSSVKPIQLLAFIKVLKLKEEL